MFYIKYFSIISIANTQNQFLLYHKPFRQFYLQVISNYIEKFHHKSACKQQLHRLCVFFIDSQEKSEKFLRCIYDSDVVINGNSTRYCSKSMEVVVVVVVGDVDVVIVVVSSSPIALLTDVKSYSVLIGNIFVFQIYSGLCVCVVLLLNFAKDDKDERRRFHKVANGIKSFKVK